MKKILLTLTAVAGLTVASQAQEFGFGKTDLIVEGNIGFGKTDNKNTEVKVSGFKFNPKVGYFVTDKIAVGINLIVNDSVTNNYKENAEKKVKTNSFGAGVFGRYYFLEVGSRFKTYAELNVDYTGSKGEVTTSGTTVKGDKTNTFGVNAGIGANYFLTEKIAVNFAFANIIGYNTSKVDADGAKAISSFGANVNEFNNFFNTATFGLTFKF
ncbi:outer membrane beta-barrel protein [Sphingobacterium faecale]|uniref:Porin family protein n=1 Tax=Sphingobacterium faecale TaxID=2803775 RepID=A0ABS1R0B3_9SPHI|nr:OmpW family outer membrane protein [Sphingobacterium faecale]MBL1408014.1 porin family protein [Sphingobacterium faecale]